MDPKIVTGLDPEDEMDIIMVMQLTVNGGKPLATEQAHVALEDQEERRKVSDEAMAATLKEILTR